MVLDWPVNLFAALTRASLLISLNTQSSSLHSFETVSLLAGTLALFESDCAESLKGDRKAHPDALLRILIALHQFTDGIEHKIVVGQPILTNTKSISTEHSC